MLIKSIEEKYLKKNPPVLKVGQTVKVSHTLKEGGKEKITIFEGIIIGIRGVGTSKNFIVRRIAADKIGVEKVFPLHSPLLVKIEIIKEAKVKRAKLYYLRGKVGAKAKFKNEKMIKKVWEDTSAKEELEKIEKEMEEAAKLKKAKKQEKEAELEKKFKQARPQRLSSSDGGQVRGENNEKPAAESGDEGGDAGGPNASEKGTEDSGDKSKK